jgi:homoserine acetyltransferase
MLINYLISQPIISILRVLARQRSQSDMAMLIDQSLYNVDSFQLECGVVLRDVPIAYKTWGIT